MRILIVDDNVSMRKVLAALFASAGHEVVGAFADGNGIEELIRQTTPELVCLDYHLPGRDGLAILKAIQSEAPQIDVVFMTASSESGIEEKAADAGASGFIRKPSARPRLSKSCAPSKRRARRPTIRRPVPSSSALVPPSRAGAARR